MHGPNAKCERRARRDVKNLGQWKRRGKACSDQSPSVIATEVRLDMLDCGLRSQQEYFLTRSYTRVTEHILDVDRLR